jgi:hypothetical protein
MEMGVGFVKKDEDGSTTLKVNLEGSRDSRGETSGSVKAGVVKEW